MKNIYLFIALLMLSTSGTAQQTLTETLTHDGIQREYILYVPTSYTGNTAVPLVFNFHGYTSNATEQMWYGDFRGIADTAGFLVVHPEGTLLNGATHFNVGGWTIGSTVDDVGFTEAMINSLSAQYNIDPDRIYASGMSNGGFMSFLLACQLSDKIAAIASITGSMTPEIYNACNPTHPTPVLQIHGTSDGTVPYTGQSWTRSVADVVSYWQNFNNCAPSPSLTALPNTSPNDGSTVEHFVYSGGDNQVNVEHFKITGGGHTWPGAFAGVPAVNYDIDASEEVWKFFSRYDINGLISPSTSVDPLLQANTVQVYPNPTHSHLTIEREYGKEIPFDLISIQGKIVMTGTLRSPQQEIDLSALPESIYFLKVGAQLVKVWKQEY